MRVSGSWNHFEWRDNKWQMCINDVAYFRLNTTELDVDVPIVASGSSVLTGNLEVTDDLNAAGGFRSQLGYTIDKLKQEQVRHMTASMLNHGTGSLRHSMVTAGSVLGISLYGHNCDVWTGALTGNLTVDGVPDESVQVMIETGSAVTITTLVDKDTVTFSGSQGLGVMLTASDDYTTNLDIESGSWNASLLIET